jgi:hypothetical protein
MTSLGITVRTLAGFGIGAALAVAILLGLAVPESASAGAYKCEDRFLEVIDEMQLRAAALKVLPKSVHLDKVGPCRNPDSAHARISTKKVLSIEGVQQWYEFTCWRVAQPWKCDPPEFKQLIAYTSAVRGIRRRVALSFDRDVSLARARVLSQRALEIYADPAILLSECEIGGIKRADLVDLRNGPLPSTNKLIDVRVSHEGLGDSAWLPDVSLSIQFSTTTDGAGNAEEMCWNQVIVTA